MFLLLAWIKITLTALFVMNYIIDMKLLHQAYILPLGSILAYIYNVVLYPHKI